MKATPKHDYDPAPSVITTLPTVAYRSPVDLICVYWLQKTHHQSTMVTAPHSEPVCAHAGPTGHGGDVRCVDWHPTTSLLASSGRDAVVKLWDCRLNPESAMLATLQGHKQAVNKVRRIYISYIYMKYSTYI